MTDEQETISYLILRSLEMFNEGDYKKTINVLKRVIAEIEKLENLNN